MAFTCGFFNSQNGDRKYNAEQMASIFDGLIKDGVYDTVGDIFAVTPGTGMQVLVGSGRAWFDHTWNNNDAPYPLAITAADVSLPRYDAVVLETNHSDTVRTNRLRVLTGTPASNPVKPTMMSTTNVKQHPLAYIKVTAGAKAITQSMIQVVVGTSECPFVTGIIDTAQIDALFQQWNGEFNEWFDNLKAQLSDNVVANLQGQIDQKVAKADVATTADIEAGTSTTKWVSPKGLKESGNIYKVGDIQYTARTDLGDNWALCNGETFLKHENPALNALNSDLIGFKAPNENHVGEHFYILGNTIVLARANHRNGSVPYIEIDISNDFGVTWRTVKKFTDSYIADGGIQGTPADVWYHDGTWVVLANSYSGHTAIVIATNDLSATTWNNYTVSAEYELGRKVRYYEGKWRLFILGQNSNQLVAYSSSNAFTNSWTKLNIGPSITTLIKDVKYINGYYVILVNGQFSSGYVYYNNNSFESTWSQSGIVIGQQGTSIWYVNNKWIVTSQPNQGISGQFILAYSDDLSTWNTLYKTLTNISTGTSVIGTYAYYNDGYSVLVYGSSGFGVLKLSDLSSSASTTYIPSYTQNGAGPFGTYVMDSEYFYQLAQYRVSSSKTGYILLSTDFYTVPKIAIDGAYAYIKIK